MTRAQYKAKYYHYLNSIQWQCIKEWCHIRDKWTCRGCGYCNKYGRGLVAHHASYRYIFREWQGLHTLVTLCKHCHFNLHFPKPKLKQLEAKTTLSGTAEVEVRKAR